MNIQNECTISSPYIAWLVDVSSILYQYIHYLTVSFLTGQEERRCLIL